VIADICVVRVIDPSQTPLQAFVDEIVQLAFNGEAVRIRKDLASNRSPIRLQEEAVP